MDPILAQQNQNRQGWDRQAWRTAEQFITLVQAHYRWAVRSSVVLRDSANAGLPDRRAAPPGTGAGAQADRRRGAEAIPVTLAGPAAWKGSEPVIVGVEVKVGRKLAGEVADRQAAVRSSGVSRVAVPAKVLMTGWAQMAGPRMAGPRDIRGWRRWPGWRAAIRTWRGRRTGVLVGPVTTGD